MTFGKYGVSRQSIEDFPGERIKNRDFLYLVVKQCDAPLTTLDGLAVSIGPGSFTGLRIGLALAKGLAFGGDLPIVGVNTADAIAASVYPKDERMIVALASRKGEVYAAKYRILDNAYTREGQVEAVVSGQFAEWADGVSLIAGTGVASLQSAGVGEFEFVSEHYWQIGSAAVARLGARRIIAGDFDDVNVLEPEYVKPFFTTAVTA